mgnify:CR=1 FL=1
MSYLLLLPFGILCGAAYHYPDQAVEVMYSIGHTTLEVAAYVQIKLCPKKSKKQRMSRPVMSEAAQVLSAAVSLDPKEA